MHKKFDIIFHVCVNPNNVEKLLNRENSNTLPEQ